MSRVHATARMLARPTLSLPGWSVTAAIGLIVLMLLSSLGSRSTSTASFYLLILLAVTMLAYRRIRGGAPAPHALPPAIALPLAAPLLAMLLTAAVIADLGGSHSEKMLRFALAIPLLALLAYVPVARLRHVQWGLIGGAYVGAALVLFGVQAGDSRDYLTSLGANYNAVTVANLNLLFGVCALFTLPWRLTRLPRLEAAIKIGACALCVIATVVSGTRSSWMLLPVALLVGVSCLAVSRRTRWALLAAGLLSLLAAAAALYALNPRFEEVAAYLHNPGGNTLSDTSLGIRLQLWDAALHVFRQHPWFGVGPSGFYEALPGLVGEGVVTPRVAREFGETHNDFMQALVSHGLVGLLAFMALYWVPAAWFARQLRQPDRQLRVAAQLGLLLCLGFTVFSLTELMFRNMRSVPIYCVLLVVFARLARPDATHAVPAPPAPPNPPAGRAG